MVETCRWHGCTRDSVVRVPKESPHPTVGEFDLPLCHRHSQRATGTRFPTTQTLGGVRE